MCLICDQLDQGFLQPWEAKRNLEEMAGDLEMRHVMELLERLEESGNEL